MGLRRNGMAKKALNKALAQRTLGPIPDLERHLPSDWWRTLFNSLYLKTDGDVVENETNTKQEVDRVLALARLEPNDRILDLCCGQGRHSLELARRNFRHVTGIDRSRYLIRLARKRAKGSDLAVSFHEGDARKFRLMENHFHCVMLLGNSFGYFEHEDDDRAVLESVRRALKSLGVLVLDLVEGQWMRKNFKPRSWEWIDQNHFVCRERSMARDGKRLVSREIVTHAEKGVIVDQFYAERVYSREQIQELLQNVGFESVRFHDGLETASTRGEDLGMMEHRMWITAVCPRKVGKQRAQRPFFPEVTVLLGDPTRLDQVKPDNSFTEEDEKAVNKLKDALSELDGYSFSYFDDHAALIAELRRQHPSFVLNFCDEGFLNDAFMELHIPAILEMLGIPYSGSGPACLGLCYNKSLVRSAALSLDIPVPLETYNYPEDQSVTIPSVFPALVKPNFGDGSYGISQDAVILNKEELMEYVQKMAEEFPGYPLLLQEFLEGPEYSVGIIGNPGMKVQILPILEVDYSGLPADLPRILGYESKWTPDSPYWKHVAFKEASLNEETHRKLSDYASLLFERLGCSDYARIDFRADAAGEIKLLEVNPNPAWCWDGKMNMMAGFAGLRYAEYLESVLKAAQERVVAERDGKFLRLSSAPFSRGFRKFGPR